MNTATKESFLQCSGPLSYAKIFNISVFLIGSDRERLERDILGYVKQTEKRLAQQQADNEAQVEKIMLHMSKEIESLKEELKQSEARLANIDKTNTDKPNKDKLNKD